MFFIQSLTLPTSYLSYRTEFHVMKKKEARFFHSDIFEEEKNQQVLKKFNKKRKVAYLFTMCFNDWPIVNYVCQKREIHDTPLNGHRNTPEYCFLISWIKETSKEEGVSSCLIIIGFFLSTDSIKWCQWKEFIRCVSLIDIFWKWLVLKW